MVDWNSSESSAIALNCFKSHLEHKGKWWAYIFFLDFLQKITRKLAYLSVLAQIPMLFCLLFILLRFAVLLGIQVRKQWFSVSRSGTCVSGLEMFMYILKSCLYLISEK